MLNNRFAYKFTNGIVKNKDLFDKTICNFVAVKRKKSNNNNIKLHAAKNLA